MEVQGVSWSPWTHLFGGELVKRCVELLVCERVGRKKEGVMEQGALLERKALVVGVGVRPSAHYRDVLREVVKWRRIGGYLQRIP